MGLTGIDHVVLTVRDLDRTCRFYTEVLGLRLEVSPEGRRSLHVGAQKINLHQAGREFEPKAAAPTPGSADLCFLTGASPDDVLAHFRACGVDVVAGPVRRTGAQGALLSVYVRDPDGNLVEIGAAAP
ncbi:MAG TPA: VOC family protein [Dehalococcoidia bacterium]